MDLKKIIKEEMDSFDWTEDISAIPEGRFAITFCDYDMSDDDGDTIKKVIAKLEGHFDYVHPRVFNSPNIYDSLYEVMMGERHGTYGFMIYVRPDVNLLKKDDKNVANIGWDDCDSYEKEEITYTHEEFMNL
jgi:hypothetical protein